MIRQNRLVTDSRLIGMLIVGFFLSFILLLGFVFGLPIFLAICYSSWWLLLLIVTIPIGLVPFALFINRGEKTK